MQFQLPTNLQTELIAYDPQLKALARNQNKPKTKKSKYPLGNPNDLIPSEIIKPSILQAAIDKINGEPAAQRFSEFTRISNWSASTQGNDVATVITHAILYHYEQCWYAAWLPPKGQEDDYIYGYAYAYKDTATAFKGIPHALRQEKDICIYKTFGRSQFAIHMQKVTKQDVINGMDKRQWNIPSVTSYYDKSRYMYEPLKRFEKQLVSSIPTWEDSHSIFERMKTTCIADVLTRSHHVEYWRTKDRATWLPSVETLFEIIRSDDPHMGYNVFGHDIPCYKNILHILDTPFFRKWIQDKCNECIERLQNPNTKTQTEIKQPWNVMHHLFKQIEFVNTIWEEKCSIDYYQTNLNVLLNVLCHPGMGTVTSIKDWLKEHMPVASFFTLINKYYEKQIEEAGTRDRAYRYSTNTGLYICNFRELDDTFSMLAKVLNNKSDDLTPKPETLAPPKRWRITEFHDYVQAEAWKIANANESLPQDLFPTAIKLQHEQQLWTFIQPIDTHQLGAWGQAVRNCVGNATGYADGVRKKRHFIVLCMIDNKPQFTVQLKVSMGMMTVDQIAGISNARLTEEQRESYTKVFGQALQQREKMLASA